MLKLLTSFVAAVADEHDYVRFEPRCVVSEDPGEIVRHARPIDERARRQLLEQHIARLSRERSDARRSRDARTDHASRAGGRGVAARRDGATRGASPA
jgi:hypothetical protein